MPTITLSLTDQQHQDAIVTALEGGSNYWYSLSDKAVEEIERYAPNARFYNSKGEQREPLSISFWAALKAGAVIPINDAEDEAEKIGEISLASIAVGEQRMLEKSRRHFDDLLNESGDAITADVWFQYCSLGEVVYG